MSNQAVRRTILARIIRDIPTFGGVIPKGVVLAVIDGQEKSNRWNLGLPSGGVVVSCARRGDEFELAEETSKSPATTSAMNLIDEI